MFPSHLKHARRRLIFFYFCNVTYNPLKNFPWFHDFSRSDPHTGFQDFPGFFQVFPGFFTFSMTNFRHSMTFENHWNSIPFPYLFPGQTKFHTDSILFWNSMTSSHPDLLTHAKTARSTLTQSKVMIFWTLVKIEVYLGWGLPKLLSLDQ